MVRHRNKELARVLFPHSMAKEDLARDGQERRWSAESGGMADNGLDRGAFLNIANRQDKILASEVD